MSDRGTPRPRRPLSATSRSADREVLLLGLVFLATVIFWNTRALFPLKLLVVLFHELSHALAALLTGGTVLEIVVNPDQGGHCVTQGGSPLLILSAGYLGSMLLGAAVLLTAARTDRDQTLAMGLGAALIGATLWKVRNGFGFFFGLAAGAALFVVGARLPRRASDLLLKVVGTTSCLYAVLDIKDDILDRPELRSDARMLAEITWVPTVVWGLVWIAVALVVTFYTVRAAVAARR